MKTVSDSALAEAASRGGLQSSERMGNGEVPLSGVRHRQFAGSPEDGQSASAGEKPQPGGDVHASGGTSPKPDKGQNESKTKQQRPKAVRVLLWILRKSIVPIVFVVALIGGLYTGYVILGHGPEDDVWLWSTWKHIYDLVFAE
jgi:cobalamin biosynthesis Mg chelatase CobN